MACYSFGHTVESFRFGASVHTHTIAVKIHHPHPPATKWVPEHRSAINALVIGVLAVEPSSLVNSEVISVLCALDDPVAAPPSKKPIYWHRSEHSWVHEIS